MATQHTILHLVCKRQLLFPPMSYHPGYVESCHEPRKNVDWYEQEKLPRYDLQFRYSRAFCNALQTGGFIPCGNSGGLPFVFLKPNDTTADLCLHRISSSLATCAFVYGTPCEGKILKRRWTCCRKELVCKFDDMITLKGCRLVTMIPNFTP